jgi:hypothetical protein
MAALSALPAFGCASHVAPPAAAPIAHPVKDDQMGQQMGPLQALIRLALDDAARRSRRDASTLKVASAEAVTWPDGSIGCPEPGMQYAQALMPGYRIRIQAGAQFLEYHAGPRGQPFLCPAGRVTAPAATDPRT